MDNNERRRYFRVDLNVLFSYRLISQSEKAELIATLYREAAAFPDERKLFMMLDSDLQDQLKQLRVKEKQLGDILELMNRKINLIAQGGPLPKVRKTVLDNDPMIVNMSACGLAFMETHPLKTGQSIELELALLPEQYYFKAYGEIVACENKPLSPEQSQSPEQPYRVSIDFQAVRDEDVEKIIQSIMKKESENLKAKRHLHK